MALFRLGLVGGGRMGRSHMAALVAGGDVRVVSVAEPDAATPPQALPRVTLQVAARVLPREGDEYAAAKSLYLARFPDAAVTFELADFAIVVLQPESARLVAGFGRAFALVGDKLEQWLRA